MDQHLLAASHLTEQRPAALTHITSQNFVPVLRRPYQVMLAVPYRMADSLGVFHPSKPSTIRRLKASRLLIYRGL